MRDLIKKSLSSGFLVAKFERWTGDLPDGATYETHPHCLPLGRSEDSISGMIDPIPNQGNVLPISGFMKVSDEEGNPVIVGNEITLGISVSRPADPVEDKPAMVKLLRRIFGEGWTEIGVFEVALGAKKSLTVLVDWPGTIGSFAIEPIPGEWCVKPGKYFFALEAYGARRPVECEDAPKPLRVDLAKDTIAYTEEKKRKEKDLLERLSKVGK